jgi:pimeloyl-ACP methyl ester carboxylesterase
MRWQINALAEHFASRWEKGWMMLRTWRSGMLGILWASALAGGVLSSHALEGGEPVAKRSDWFGYQRLDFQVDGRQCLLVLPKRPAAGNPWIWRTEFFGHEPQADLALLGKGFHAAYMDVQNMYGAPVAMGHMDAFYTYLTSQRGLAPKVTLEGFSRGGLFAFNWAAKNPEKVACIYADAPVCDFKSWPGGKGRGKGSSADWDLLKKVYGFSEDDAMRYPLNPVDNLKPLAAAKIPLLLVCGEADTTVPIEENGRLVQKRYRQLGGPVTLIAKPFCEHHPHSLKEPAPIVDFILRSTPGMTPPAARPPATPRGFSISSSIERKE